MDEGVKATSQRKELRQCQTVPKTRSISQASIAVKSRRTSTEATSRASAKAHHLRGGSPLSAEMLAAGYLISDGGILLFREADRRLGLVQALDAVLPDPRDPSRIVHRQSDLLRQRIYGLALGYEDLNDHGTLRLDPAWQTALERSGALASDSTLCRLEQRVDRKAADRGIVSEDKKCRKPHPQL